MSKETINVLLLEDNPGDARLIEEFLEETNSVHFLVNCCGTLAGGIRSLQESAPDIILLDLGLPDSQGLDTLERLVALVTGLPIVVLTGLNDTEIAFKAVQSGAQDYLIKGEFTQVMLVRSVRYSINRKQTENKLGENEERLRLAIDAANLGLYDHNLETGEIVTNSNYAVMLGHDPDSFLETQPGWLGRLHPDDRDAIEKLYASFIQGKAPEFKAEYRMCTKSGGWKWLYSIGSTVENKITGQPSRFIGIFSDINDRVLASQEINRLFEESRQRLINLQSLSKIETEIISDSNLDKTLNLILDQVKAQLQVDAVAILFFNEKQKTLDYAADLGFTTNLVKNAHVKYGTELAGKAAEKSSIVRYFQLNDPTLSENFSKMAREEKFLEYYGISLSVKGKLIGVMEVFFRIKRILDDEWFSFFKTLASSAAIAIENFRLVDGLQKANVELLNAYDATIKGWSMALDLRDKETEGHTQRVADMTLHLAEKMGVEKDFLIHIYRGALLHDIGKLGVPDNILLKPGKLTDEEWVVMRRHPEFAFNMLSPIDYLHKAIDIPLYHHEKWDGSGYPKAIKGTQIPLAARIFAIVDVYDAITSDRPYRKALPKEEALEYISTQRGHHFDPKVVDEFLEYIHPLPRQTSGNQVKQPANQ